MLRKTSIFLLIGLLLTATIGVGVSRHYCSGELRNVTLYSIKTKCCGENARMSAGCCNDEHEYERVEDNFAVSAGVQVQIPDFGQVTLPRSMNLDLPESPAVPALFTAEYGPPPPIPDICIRNQCFRI